MLIGVLCALGAGLIWGIVFVTPQLLPQYTGPLLAFGRYLAFGLIALPLGWQARRGLRALQRADWIEALGLSLVGNILYYSALATAIQLADAPLPTMVIGTLPLVIAIASNLSERSAPWRRLAPALVVLAAGIALTGMVLSTAYYRLAVPNPLDLPLGPDPWRFVLWMLALGLLASWLGTLLWNAAAKRLPTSLSGQLIVFETLAALAYAWLLRRDWPDAVTLAGVGLLVAGVVLGVRVFTANVPTPPSARK